MTEYTHGNIFDANVEALVNPVNCVGVMGAGLALEFKHRFPENYKLYKEACERGEVQLGQMFTTTAGMISPKYIINFPTKHHWRDRSSYKSIQDGMSALLREAGAHDVLSIAIPALGCGLGGLEWKRVKDIMSAWLDWSGRMRVIIYEPTTIAVESLWGMASK